ncbi:hypothetical protein QBC37DRAFT_165162 [Rhypophila decipiens]|uniref:Uncharacterized protein n=1 Tax=Rhypophila decipiens TaxID=261697 RepID=A0AAN6YJL4_9PEZI|nr:hypothetical protein QBC37DRAFT_165162 [Rhypophila decipiens]
MGTDITNCFVFYSHANFDHGKRTLSQQHVSRDFLARQRTATFLHLLGTPYCPKNQERAVRNHFMDLLNIEYLATPQHDASHALGHLLTCRPYLLQHAGPTRSRPVRLSMSSWALNRRAGCEHQVNNAPDSQHSPKAQGLLKCKAIRQSAASLKYSEPRMKPHNHWWLMSFRNGTRAPKDTDLSILQLENVLVAGVSVRTFSST